MPVKLRLLIVPVFFAISAGGCTSTAERNAPAQTDIYYPGKKTADSEKVGKTAKKAPESSQKAGESDQKQTSTGETITRKKDETGAQKKPDAGLEQNEPTEQQPIVDGPPQTLSFAAVGDIMCHDTQYRDAYQKKCKCYNFKPAFEKVRPFLNITDFTIGNLETTLPGEKYAGYPLFGSPDALAEAAAYAGFDILTTANNHSADRGKKGLVRTLKVLQKNKIASLGTYKTVEEYKKNRFLVVEKNGLKIAMLNYTYGLNGMPLPKGTGANLIKKELIAADLKLARSVKPDSIFVLYHYGDQYKRKPVKRQKELVDFAFKNGADVVLGGHPHVIQKYEIKTVTDIYKETRPRLVIYSLGNFISAQIRLHTKGGIIFYFTLKKNKNGRARFDNIDYRLVWVSRGGRNGFRYRLVPLAEKLPQYKDVKFSEYELRQMKRFFKENNSLLKESVENVEKYYQSLEKK